MGQEISQIDFSPEAFARFQRRLWRETRRFCAMERAGAFSDQPPVGGFEIEGWLVDDRMRPAPENVRFLEGLDERLFCFELARFNVELNTEPERLHGSALSRFERGLKLLVDLARRRARELGLHFLLIGTLPTLRHEDLRLENLSPLNRYRALNRQILRLRGGRPIQIEISGKERLSERHHDVMLESATTSFQIHLQCPQREAVARYNASLLASAATVAISANAPFLFGHDLWDESRIPIFEQAIPTATFEGHAHRIKRVDFGLDFCHEGLSELFEENLYHPPLLPVTLAEPEEHLPHLRLHNGTIWRWNRPLVGFDPSGKPHLRVEHRVLPAGPTVVDMVANAAFYFGLVEDLTAHPVELPFRKVRENFYRAARWGWSAEVVWEGRAVPLKALLEGELLERARRGLERLEIDPHDIDRYLPLLQGRLAADQTGAIWQRRALEGFRGDAEALVRRYLELQEAEIPVHRWPL